MQKFTYAVVALLFVSACGKDKASLTDAQKSKIQSVISSVKTVQGASGAQTKSFVSTKQAIAIDTATQEKLRAKLMQGQCDIKTDSSVSGKAAKGLVAANVSVSGATCPIAMTAKVGAMEKSTNGRVELSAEYFSRDEEFTQLSKIRSFKISGFSEVGESGIKVNLDIRVDSVEHGQVAMTALIDVDMANRKGLVEMKVSFPDFTKIIRATAEGENEKYEIDGQEASKEDVEALVKSIQLQ